MATDANNSGGNNEPKIEFTPEQQTKVNALIQEAQGRAGREARENATKLDNDLKTAKDELAAAQVALAKATTPGDRKDAKDDVASLQAQMDEMKRAQQTREAEVERYKNLAQSKETEAAEARKEVLNVRKRVEIANAASKVNFVNNEVVTKLTENDLQWDAEKNRFMVVGANGQPRLNAAFEPMSLDEFYNEFANLNPYLVRGDVKGGTGSSQNRGTTNTGRYEVKQLFGSESSAVLAQKVKKENPSEYARLRAIAVEGGILAA